MVSDENDVKYWRPAHVPPELEPLERARIAAANIRIWADWLLETGPALEKTDTLKDASRSEGEP